MHLVSLTIFLALGAGGIFLALTGPEVRNRLAAAALMGGVPLFMAGLCILGLVRREALTIRGERVVSQGIFRLKEIGLLEVTRARWRRWPGFNGSLVLRNESARLPVYFDNYEAEDRDRIIQYLRSVLPPEVQTNWNLFAYNIAIRKPRSVHSKLGPDEVLLRRDRWDPYLVPSLLVFGLAGIILWKIMGELLCLTMPLAPLAGWALIRASTPAEGMVAQKISSAITPEMARFLWFVLLWGMVAIAGLLAHGLFLPRQREPDMYLIVGFVVWYGVAIFEAVLEIRRQFRRDREAADLAAKARGETKADPWQSIS